MREILFRGIDEGTNEWVYGYYYESQKPSDFGGERRYYIFDSKTISKYNVLPETVGQYTGLTDKNDNKIFEGDIINIEYDETVVKNTIVQYIGTSFYGSTDYDDWELDGYYELEIMGNIYDNQELLNN